MNESGCVHCISNFSMRIDMASIVASTNGGLASKEPPVRNKSSLHSKKLPLDPKGLSVSKNAEPVRSHTGEQEKVDEKHTKRGQCAVERRGKTLVEYVELVL